MEDFVSPYFPLFGVEPYHKLKYFGKGGNNGRRVKIFVIDTGFHDLDSTAAGIQTHPDLENVKIYNFASVGFPGDSELPSHGEMTCSLLASPANDFGILGICPEAEIYLGDVDNEEGNLFQSSLVKAFDKAIELKVDIISISLGSSQASPELKARVEKAANMGILIFAAAGNSGKRENIYPASFSQVISVASVNIEHQLSKFNTINDKIDLFAPGEDLKFPKSDGTLFVASGTSFSCPFAAGLAALYISNMWDLAENYKPSRDDIVTILEGKNHLNCSNLGYVRTLKPPQNKEMRTLNNENPSPSIPPSSGPGLPETVVLLGSLIMFGVLGGIISQKIGIPATF